MGTNNNLFGGKRNMLGRKDGVKQTPVLLKIDNDLMDFFRAKRNRNRYVNELIRKDMEIVAELEKLQSHFLSSSSSPL